MYVREKRIYMYAYRCFVWIGTHLLLLLLIFVGQCIPPGTSGGWIAYAYINHWLSVYNDRWCEYPSGQMHELGHNLNLAHSGEGATYDDQSGMMGYSVSTAPGSITLHACRVLRRSANLDRSNVI